MDLQDRMMAIGLGMLLFAMGCVAVVGCVCMIHSEFYPKPKEAPVQMEKAP